MLAQFIRMSNCLLVAVGLC